MENRSFLELLIITALGSGIGVFTGNYFLQKMKEKQPDINPGSTTKS